jgi:hypothetical protein
MAFYAVGERNHTLTLAARISCCAFLSINVSWRQARDIDLDQT